MNTEINVLTSSGVLETLCIRWFRKNFGRTPWFPLRYRNLLTYKPRAKIVDVVLFGNFVGQLHDARLWPLAEYRIWTLCNAAKTVTCNMMDLPPESIGVIPRYELIPKAKKENPFPKKGEKWSLVFGGRFLEFKNLDLSLRVGSILQTKYNQPVQLVFFGSFQSDEMRAKTWRLYHSLPWEMPPFFKEPLTSSAWTRAQIHRPVFHCFSTFEKEDYGVSLAQAQKAGWPCIISAWGGHLDVTGENVLKISHEMIGRFGESDMTRHQRAEAISAKIVQSLKRFEPEDGVANGHAPLIPVPLSLDRLKLIKADFYLRSSKKKWSEPEFGKRYIKYFSSIH